MNDTVNQVTQHVTNYNWADYAILAVISVSVVVAFLRGFIREAVSLAIWVVAVFVSVRFSGPLSDTMAPYLSSALMRYLIAFFALFLAAMLFGVVVNMMLRTLIEKSGMSATDRVLGIFFGAARGVLVVAVMLMFISLTPFQSSTLIAQSALVPHFKMLVGWLDGFLPNEMKHFSTWMNTQSAPNSGSVHQQVMQHVQNLNNTLT